MRRVEEARRGEEVRRKAEEEAGQDTEEQYRTAVKHFFGSGVKKDYVEAARWYRKAAKQGHAMAEGRLRKLGLR